MSKYQFSVRIIHFGDDDDDDNDYDGDELK